jgi:hypothetical protein
MALRIVLSPSGVYPVGEKVGGLERDIVDKECEAWGKLTAKYSFHCRTHVENVQVVDTARVAKRCVPYPALPVCDGFEDYSRLLLLSLKLTGKLNRTDLPGPKLSINGTDAAWKATVCINLENAAQVVFSRLASILDAVQLANSTAKLG